MAVPTLMKYITILEPGQPDVLVEKTGAVPALSENEIMIRVEAAGVNRPDVLQREGNYNPPPGASLIPGLEVAGEVVDVADGVTAYNLGDKVCALVSGGGYAEYCPAPVPQVLPIPEGLSVIEAAGVPENYFTVWTNVFERGGLQAGEIILIHGGSSGIGTTAIQLAHHFGAIVITTAGNEMKCAACAELGADYVINYRQEDFVARVTEITDGKGVNLILDMVCKAVDNDGDKIEFYKVFDSKSTHYHITEDDLFLRVRSSGDSSILDDPSLVISRYNLKLKHFYENKIVAVSICKIFNNKNNFLQRLDEIADHFRIKNEKKLKKRKF